MTINIETVCTYKGKTIVRFNNNLCYYIIIIGDYDNTFGSVADAKKYINGQPTSWSIVPMWDDLKEMVAAVETMIWPRITTAW